MPVRRMSPPLWNQTLDAYDCIMVPIQDWIDRIQGCDPRDVTRFTAPRTFLKLRKRHALCQSAFNSDPQSASEYDPPPGGWDRWGGVRDPLLLSEVETTAQPHLFYADHPRLPFHRCTTKRSFCNQTRWVKLDADFPPSGSSLQAFPQV